MLFHSFDWIILAVFFSAVLGIGLLFSKTAGKNQEQFFLGGKSMPWWLLGISMVATTFSADTPNLVTGLVREGGVARNWVWWSFLITGMVTVFIYARLWRRSNVLTDLEFYEIRYNGKAASFLRGFRAIYLGVLFNCLIMGTVTLAAIKIGSVMFGLAPWLIVVGGSAIVVAYSALGGIKGVIWTDFFQFAVSMTGAFYAAYVALNHPEIGSLSALFDHPNLEGKLDMFPNFNNPSLVISMFVIPIAVQWWSVWYPGSEPGGGGYIAQRMLAAKDENHAVGATLFFNVAHYALRPWPWIIVALASLVLYPDLTSIKEVFPDIEDQYLGNDIAYPVMLTLLSPGWLGFVTASLIAAFMSTISTHLNWGSSYLVHDFYSRFIRPDAPEKELVQVGRVSTLLLMVISGSFALFLLRDATQAFNILLLSGAGTGAIYLLRWFWWRINALTELVAMISGAVTAFALGLLVSDDALTTPYLDGFTVKLLLAVSITSVVWILTALTTRPESYETLRKFYELTHPGGPGWEKIIRESKERGDEIEVAGKWGVPQSLLMVFVGCIGTYAALIGTGSFLYGNFFTGGILMLVFILSAYLVRHHLIKTRFR
ncbi:MAG: sodium:solute symporter family protein [Oceanipulchritudo sp.]